MIPGLMGKTNINTTDTLRIEDSIAPHLVWSYLVHNCYGATASSFLHEWNKSTDHENDPAYKSLEYRQHLSQLVLDGKTSEAIEYAHTFFSHVFVKGDVAPSELHFRLLCQHFVELIRQNDTHAALMYVEQTLAPITVAFPHLGALLHVQALRLVSFFEGGCRAPGVFRSQGFGSQRAALL